LRIGDIVAPLHAEIGPVRLISPDGAADSGTAHSAEGRRMSVTRRSTQRKTQRGSDRRRSNGTPVRRFRIARDLAVRIIRTIVLVLLEHFEGLIWRGEDPHRRTARFHRASSKQRGCTHRGNLRRKPTHERTPEP
jgi:hypothetical protein